jgi:hypothetical protein
MAEKDYTAQLSAGKKRAVGLKVSRRDRQPLVTNSIIVFGVHQRLSLRERVGTSIAAESASFHFKMQKAN